MPWIARTEEALAGAHRRLDRSQEALADARAKVARLETARAERAAWHVVDGWRLDRTTELERAVAHHWADVVLKAVRADDPLAFGVERLCQARATYGSDLRQVLDGLPADGARTWPGPRPTYATARTPCVTRSEASLGPRPNSNGRDDDPRP
jgi:hypothetical protein